MVGMQSGTVTVEPVWQFLKKLNYHMTQQFYSKVYSLKKWNRAIQKPFMNADSSIIHKSKKSGRNLNIHQLMDKQMVYPCYGLNCVPLKILFGDMAFREIIKVKWGQNGETLFL